MFREPHANGAEIKADLFNGGEKALWVEEFGHIHHLVATTVTVGDVPVN